MIEQYIYGVQDIEKNKTEIRTDTNHKLNETIVDGPNEKDET